MSKKIKGDLMLLLTAMIWGSSFVAQKSGMELIGPFAFNGIRTIIAGLSLLLLIFIMGRVKNNSTAAECKADSTAPEDKTMQRRTLIKGGVSCGIVLCIAGMLQQIGMIYTTAGKAGFITALYVVLVPVMGLVLRKKVRPLIWLCVLASAIGLYLLCMPASGGAGSINKGDLIVLACAVCFAVHILLIDHFSPKVDGVRLSCIQFFVAGVIAVILMFPLDPLLGYDIPSFSQLLDVWIPILYSGVLSCGVGYTLQIVAQADTDPTVASMILCLESVFAVIAGMIILGESMSLRETIGCVIMFAAILAAQMPAKNSTDLS